MSACLRQKYRRPSSNCHRDCVRAHAVDWWCCMVVSCWWSASWQLWRQRGTVCRQRPVNWRRWETTTESPSAPSLHRTWPSLPGLGSTVWDCVSVTAVRVRMEQIIKAMTVPVSFILSPRTASSKCPTASTTRFLFLFYTACLRTKSGPDINYYNSTKIPVSFVWNFKQNVSELKHEQAPWIWHWTKKTSHRFIIIIIMFV